VRAPGGRRLPAGARAAIVRWLDDHPADTVELTSGEAKAHQRLLREFLAQHLPDPRALKAFTVWEQGSWSAIAP
jgi:DNA repair protein RecO (recombination protein O)